MPNWVFNTLVVSGDKSELEAMVAHLNQPVTKHFPDTNWNDETKSWDKTPAVQQYDNPVFSFWNVVSPTDLEAYYGEEVFKKSTADAVGNKTLNESLDSNDFLQEFHRAMNFDNDWYHWNIRNWGTKWDICVANGEEYSNTNMEWTDNGEVMYRFETAWSPVTSVITALSMMYPNLEFDYEFEEEQGWGAQLQYKEGEESVIDEWDIPCSHADYKKRDRECNCEFEDPEYWYKDCPADTNKYEWNEEDGEWQEKVSDPSAMMDSSN